MQLLQHRGAALVPITMQHEPLIQILAPNCGAQRFHQWTLAKNVQLEFQRAAQLSRNLHQIQRTFSFHQPANKTQVPAASRGPQRQGQQSSFVRGRVVDDLQSAGVEFGKLLARDLRGSGGYRHKLRGPAHKDAGEHKVHQPVAPLSGLRTETVEGQDKGQIAPFANPVWRHHRAMRGYQLNRMLGHEPGQQSPCGKMRLWPPAMNVERVIGHVGGDLLPQFLRVLVRSHQHHPVPARMQLARDLQRDAFQTARGMSHPTAPHQDVHEERGSSPFSL